MTNLFYRWNNIKKSIYLKNKISTINIKLKNCIINYNENFEELIETKSVKNEIDMFEIDNRMGWVI